MADQADRGGISRRGVLGGAALAVGVGAGLVTTAAYAGTSQADAKYQDKPNGANKCGNCMQFVAPNKCKLVDGEINENGWCILYTPKG
ncbi:Iron oxidase [Beijerinckiaceae bacterium RH AL1]|jgi:High potential iron-sulfur protein|nr:high-potential iron-sulfur protein [Beijerinckiaceae bacterium]VVB49745.1 Iron oxidase [Beijerinckiaceae bacterium RH CH11]VVB49822.1 Iron oxidase [Beijerinckiaceae bacterium RH AL8]VVC57055.1 Iron oxidase [Beijerinckiaceae bacterium RH AL1]